MREPSTWEAVRKVGAVRGEAVARICYPCKKALNSAPNSGPCFWALSWEPGL